MSLVWSEHASQLGLGHLHPNRVSIPAIIQVKQSCQKAQPYRAAKTHDAVAGWGSLAARKTAQLRRALGPRHIPRSKPMAVPMFVSHPPPFPIAVAAEIGHWLLFWFGC